MSKSTLRRSSLILQALGTTSGIALMLMLDFTAQRDPADQRAEQLIAAWALFAAVYMHLVLRRDRVEAGVGFVAGAAGCSVAVLLHDRHQMPNIVVPGGYDPARLFKGLELHQQLDAAMAPGEASLQVPLTALEKDRIEQFRSRFAEVHFPILA